MSIYDRLPQFRRSIRASDTDADGFALNVGADYDPEWLRPNKIRNGGLELGWNYWDRYESGRAKVSRVSAEFYAGAWCLGFFKSVTVDTCYIENTLLCKIRPDRQYIAELYGKRFVQPFTPWGLQFKFRVNWYDSAIALLSYSDSALHTETADTWTRFRTTFTPPASAVYAKLQVRAMDDKCWGLMDSIALFPSLDQRTYTAGAFQQDEPTFEPIYAGMSETCTFDRLPSVGSTFSTDYPVMSIMFQDGTPIERKTRPQNRRLILVFSRLHVGLVEHLALLHRKVLAQTITYRDQYGEDHEVRWPGDFAPASLSNPDFAALQITLVEDGWA